MERYVCLHGLGLSNTIWEPLSRLTFNPMLTPNLPGHGGSTLKYCGFRGMWEFVRRLLPDKDWENATLLLHSMSGALLPELVRSGLRLNRLVLIEANLISGDATWSRQIAALSETNYHNYLTRLRNHSRAVIQSQLKSRHTDKDLALWAEGFELVDPCALRELSQDLVMLSDSGAALQALELIDCPVIYLRGALSGEWDTGYALLSKLQIPVVYIPRAGHYPMLDNAQETAEALASFN